MRAWVGKTCAAVAMAAVVGGCSASKPVVVVPRKATGDGGCTFGLDLSATFREVQALDVASAWTPAKCRELAGELTTCGNFSFLVFDAGAVAERCDLTAEAAADYEKALALDPGLGVARAALALLRFRGSKHQDVDAALAELSRAVHDSGVGNAQVLVDRASLYMIRDNHAKDEDGESDADRALKDLKRALAVDEGNAHAYAELGRWYLAGAKRDQDAGNPAREKLDLAALVASQGLRRRPSDAGLHEVSGLIALAAGDTPTAATELNRARLLDPRSFDDQMSYAALNASFRGFERAQEGYQRALALRPDDYDAHLGLAVALRAQIDDAHFDERVAATLREIEAARALDPARPEAYFNEAILAERYESKRDTTGLTRALDLYRTFADKAGGDPTFAEAVRDVTAVPTKSDAECMASPQPATDPSCRIGRISSIERLLEATKRTPAR